MRHILTLICLLWLGLMAQGQEKPNLVLFLTDDLGREDISPYGEREIRTPNMQKLADAGLTFENAYVASPSCAPSRAALLTGLMPARNGAEANHSKPRAEIKKWPAYLKESGYEVVAFGKVAHYKYTADYGFDHFEHDTFHDHAAIAAAVKYLENRSKTGSKPLCICVGSNWPHVPWPQENAGYDASKLRLPAGSVETALTRDWRVKYASAVTRADDDLGRVMAAVNTHLGKNTCVLFTSDHGAQWPFGKWNCYESGIAVPMIVSWPGKVKPASRTKAWVSWVDILPTFVEVASGQTPKGLDGSSFHKVLLQPEASHRDRIFATHSGDGRWNVYPIRSLRSGNWKYIRNLHPEYAFTTHIDLESRPEQRNFFASWELKAQSNPQARQILDRYHKRPPEELYDLSADPHEQNNLAMQSSGRENLEKMRGELDRWMKEQGDRQMVFAEPRLLSDPKSYGPGAPGGNVNKKGAGKKSSEKK